MDYENNRKFKVSKFQAAGNDFVLINNLKEKLNANIFQLLAKKLSDRNFSIGADGIILIDKSDKADFKMVFLNSDGNYGEMCGNGARTIAKFAHEEGLAGINMEFETMAGNVLAERLEENTYKIKLNNVTTYRKDLVVKVDGKNYKGDYIELGKPGLPHFTLELRDMDPMASGKLFKLGKALRNSKEFPKGANINFYRILGEDIKAITYERGVENFTKACGTGAASTAYSITRREEKSMSTTKIIKPGGTLIIDIQDKTMYLTGDVRRVFDTQLDLNEVLNSGPKTI